MAASCAPLSVARTRTSPHLYRISPGTRPDHSSHQREHEHLLFLLISPLPTITGIRILASSQTASSTRQYVRPSPDRSLCRRSLRLPTILRLGSEQPARSADRLFSATPILQRLAHGLVSLRFVSATAHHCIHSSRGKHRRVNISQSRCGKQGVGSRVQRGRR